MKIALINTSLVPWRGSDLIVRELALGLSQMHDVTIFAPMGVLEKPDGVEVRAPEYTRPFFARFLSAVKFLMFARRRLQGFDIVNCHHAVMSLLLPPDRLITTYHGYRGRLHFRFGQSLAAAISDAIRGTLIARALRRSQRTVVVSEALLPEVLGTVSRARCSVIYNGLRLEPLLRESLAVREGGYFLYLGRVDPDKSVDRLIALYASSAMEIPLVIAGDGRSRKALERRYSSDARIKFIGTQPRTAIPALLEGAKAFVTASSYETFCLPVIEAAAIGRPSVGPRSGSLPEVIQDGKTGFLFGAGPEFRAALLRISTASMAETNQMAVACCSWARQFTAKVMCDRYDALYAEVPVEIRDRESRNGADQADLYVR